MSSTWEIDSVYTVIDYPDSVLSNDYNIISTRGFTLPEWSNNNRARKSIDELQGILTGEFPVFAIAGSGAYLTQVEALALMQTPAWTVPE